MFEAIPEIISERIYKYRVGENAGPVSYADALQFWQHNEEFRSHFISILRDCPFTAYRWETPPVTRDTINREFEFVLVNSPELLCAPDTMTFSKQFAKADDGIVVFENLGKDAVLIVPAPGARTSSFGHLAAFIRSAKDVQIHALWRYVGKTLESIVTDSPIWLNTAGGGVAWLHVRLDSRPKYYTYMPYIGP